MSRTQESRMYARNQDPHTFHIPVMGTGFTIDTPLKVGKYGISSVVSLVDDTLIEQMRKFHCGKSGEPYQAIANNDEDARARRITAYLNLLDLLLGHQVTALRASPFEKGSEITRYFDLLPDCQAKTVYKDMLSTADEKARSTKQNDLRKMVTPGKIDVNIMTKLDRAIYKNGEKLPLEFNDSMAALRGFAKSTLSSSIIFSAGMNQHLYTYAANFPDFFPNADLAPRKKITLKVSDFRSALIQGKFLAKRGLWVSEFRIESGLNCGGHAFATKGYLMGPILEEFKQKRDELIETLHSMYNASRVNLKLVPLEKPLDVRITAQGGIGTFEEDQLLLNYYEIESTGWATPFLLVPEVTNVDKEHLARLSAATEKEVYLSESSPLGVPFWNLRNSGSEEARRERILAGKPGSACPKGHLVSNTEFTKTPVCLAARIYQQLKLDELRKKIMSKEESFVREAKIVVKSCICHDLGGGVRLKNGIDTDSTPAICCGPNIANFSKIASLEEMINHIYGRANLLTNHERVHMFIQELKLYIEHLRKEAEEFSQGLATKTPKYFDEFKENLLAGIEYYRTFAKQAVAEKRERFLTDLAILQKQLELIKLVPQPVPVA
ncbi:MAG: hypothetical protein PHR77_01885 [Kiritimatiellae bacterium]|nr:hypothetical protein [Kiritimatiellia bacterium]MDD5519389.1 hypothetical protein [Kiritimatiellia bacterium]